VKSILILSKCTVQSIKINISILVIEPWWRSRSRSKHVGDCTSAYICWLTTFVSAFY